MTSKNDRRVEITLTADEKQRGDSIISGDMDKIEEKKNDNVIVGVQAVKRDLYENGQKIDDASKTITSPMSCWKFCCLRLPNHFRWYTDFRGEGKLIVST